MRGRRNLMLTFTAYEVTEVVKNKVTTASGVFTLSSSDPKVQKGWFLVVSSTGKLVYMTKSRMESEFQERDTY